MATGRIAQLAFATAGLACALGCPVALPAENKIGYACSDDQGCGRGQRCQAGHCAASADLDAATGTEQPANDRPGQDTTGRDQAVGDGNSLDQVGHDLIERDAASDAAPVDRRSDATTATDGHADGGTDAAPAIDSGRDAAHVDSAPRADGAPFDSAPRVDAAQPDTAPRDAGCHNPALDFDGLDDLVLVPDNAGLRNLTDITVEAWVQPSTADVDGVGPFYLVAQRDATGVEGFALRLRSGWLEFCLYDGVRGYCAWAAYDDGQRLQADRWYHVVGVYDSTSRLLSVFANGALQRQESQSETPFTWVGYAGGTRLASAAGNNSGSFAGRLDEVRISSIARYSAAFATPTLPFVSDGQTVALWHLDEGSDQTVADTSPTSASGTLGANGSAGSDDPAWVTTDCIVDRVAITTPDAGTSIDAATGPGCTSTYGAVAGFVLCHENATTCEFNANTGGSNCGTLCAGLGKNCLDAFDNVDPVCDRREWMGDTCITTRGNEICVCTR